MDIFLQFDPEEGKAAQGWKEEDEEEGQGPSTTGDAADSCSFINYFWILEMLTFSYLVYSPWSIVNSEWTEEKLKEETYCI